MTWALVLGGGGPVGVAWEVGVLAGLAEIGLNAGTADRIIGTSAGAIVGSQIASGGTPRALFERYAGFPMAPPAASEAPPDLQPLLDFMMKRRGSAYPSATALADLGAYALRATTKSEHQFLAEIGQLVPDAETWPPRFACTAIDVATGDFRLWDAEAGIDVRRAVTSSCAVPGLYPPISIDGRRYMDGGMRSPTNADLARGCDKVLLLAVTIEPVADIMAAAARRELADVGAGQVALITPDRDALAAFGGNLMELGRMPAALRAGFQQGGRSREHVEALG